MELIICLSFLDFTLVKYLVHENHGKSKILDMIKYGNISGCHFRHCTSDCRSCLFKHFFMIDYCTAISVGCAIFFSLKVHFTQNHRFVLVYFYVALLLRD